MILNHNEKECKLKISTVHAFITNFKIENRCAVSYCFRSIKHEISWVKQKKIAFNEFDDERCFTGKLTCVPRS